MSAATEFMEYAVKEGVTQLGTHTVGLAFAEKFPSVEEIGATAIEIASSIAGAGAGDRLAAHLVKDTSKVAGLRQKVIAGITDEVLSSAVKSAASLASKGAGNLTAAEIAGNLGLKLAGAAGKGLTNGIRKWTSER
jgi:hypothetical protein